MALLQARPGSAPARMVDVFLSASLAVRVAGLSTLQIDLAADIGRSTLPSDTLGRMDAGLDLPNALHASLLCRTNRAHNTDAGDLYIIDKDDSTAKRSGIQSTFCALFGYSWRDFSDIQSL